MMLPALAPFMASSIVPANEHLFHYDHIIGTSLDLAVWTPHVLGSEAIAKRAAKAALDEVDRLSAILNTRNPASEISRIREISTPSRELSEVLDLYNVWERRTGGALSVRPLGANTPLNVDALGKAYIIDRAARAAQEAAPELEGLVLNIGGDIVVSGRACEIGVAEPAVPHDNASPQTHIVVKNSAVATSGSSARGAHLVNARTGIVVPSPPTATVVARDPVTANALATTLCVVGAEEGMDLVEQTDDAEAIRIDVNGVAQRTSGFAALERFREVVQAGNSNWPAGFEVSIAVTITKPKPGEDPAYLAAWVEDTSGKLVRTIVFWGSKAKYQPELASFWIITGGSPSLLYKVTKVTRVAGSYKIAWNGLDDDGKSVPKGNYRITIETNRYHGQYGKQSGMIACNNDPASTMLSGTINFEPITITYGPKPTAA